MERNTYIEFGEDASRHSVDFLLGVIEDASVTTLHYIKGISIDELHWQYETGWNTVGALLSHIISVRHLFGIMFIEGREPNEEEKEKLKPGVEMGKYLPQLITNQDLDFYLAELADSKAKIIEKIKGIPLEDFYKKREGYNPKTGYNLAWVLYHLAEDEVHHRGQISWIRKLYKARKQ